MRVRHSPRLTARRTEFGRRHRRLDVYLELRDLWVGVFVAPQAIYFCPVPCLVIRWAR